jgi:hypothetical protein
LVTWPGRLLLPRRLLLFLQSLLLLNVSLLQLFRLLLMPLLYKPTGCFIVRRQPKFPFLDQHTRGSVGRRKP